MVYLLSPTRLPLGPCLVEVEVIGRGGRKVRGGRGILGVWNTNGRRSLAVGVLLGGREGLSISIVGGGRLRSIVGRDAVHGRNAWNRRRAHGVGHRGQAVLSCIRGIWVRKLSTGVVARTGVQRGRMSIGTRVDGGMAFKGWGIRRP